MTKPEEKIDTETGEVEFTPPEGFDQFDNDLDEFDSLACHP